MSQLQQVNLEDLDKLQGEIKALADWNAAKQWALKWYGEGAARITYGVTGEYNDEGGTNYYVTSTHVKDAQGNEMLMKPEVIAEERKNREGSQYYDQNDTDEEITESILEEEDSELPHDAWEDDEYDWDLTKQPELSFSALYKEV